MESGTKTRVLSLLLLCQLCVIFCTEVTFSGQEYITYDLRSRPLGARQNQIQLSFKTMHPTGILIYSRGSQDDYVQLELRHEVLSFICYLGGSYVTKITTGEKLADGKWHSVRVQRTERLSTLILDGLSYTELSRGNFVDLNLDDILYFGGLGSNERKYFPNGGIRDFRGCIKDVEFDGIKILDKAKSKAPNFIAHGSITYSCVMKAYEPYTFTTPNSFAEIAILQKNSTSKTFATSFKFRTFYREGVLVSRYEKNVKLYLRLDAGSLICDITTPDADKIVLKLGTDLDDGDWHEVKFMVHSFGVRVSLDGRNKESGALNQSMLRMEYGKQRLIKLIVGKRKQDNNNGFVGCLLDLTFENHRVRRSEFTRENFSKGIYIGVCTIKNKCNPNPCRNGGRCSQDYLKSRCDCSAIKFEGDNCEMPIYKSSCAEYAQLGLDRNAHCLLDSDKDGPERTFTAQCNVTNAAQIFTIIEHSNMKKTLVKRVARRDTEDLIHEIVYRIGMEQIKALVKNSKKCRQYIRYDCLSSKLYKSEDVPHWRDRDNKLHTHWGGALPDTKMCLCGKDDSCIEYFETCNCDSKRDYWRHDDGYYTTPEDKLPVTMLNFPQSAGDAYFTLGPLECWGTNQKQVTTSRQNLLSQVCSFRDEPTSASIALTTKSTSSTGSRNRCNFENTIYKCYNNSGVDSKSTTVKDLLVYTDAIPQNATPKHEESQKEDSSSNSTKGLTTAAIVLISSALIIVLLLMIKFLLPRMVVCIRTHSKRGEYVVPPTGISHGYVGRIMPYVAGRRARRGRLSYKGYPEKQMEWSTGSAKTSYWV